MLAWIVGLAAQAGCCTSSGVEPLALASCERLAVSASTGVEVRTGHHGWDGSWSTHGPFHGSWNLGVGILGRPTPWLVVGLRVPLSVRFDAGAGGRAVGLAVGSLYPWATVEVTLPRGVRAGWMAGIGAVGPEGSRAGARTVETGPVWMWVHDPGFLTASVIVGVPFLGDAALTGRAVVSAGAGGRVQLGGRVAWDEAIPLGPDGFAFRSEGLRLGPAVWGRAAGGRVELSVLASPPLAHAGRNRPSSVAATVGWVAAVTP